MTEYLYGPVWYSTVPNLKVDWDIVTATYVPTTSQLVQRCQWPVYNPSTQNYIPTNSQVNTHGNVTEYGDNVKTGNDGDDNNVNT